MSLFLRLLVKYAQINPILVGGDAPPVLNLEKNQTHARSGSEFNFILVLHVLAKKTRIIGLSKENFLDFVEGRS